eukprot:13201-Heterococcus_DN1.PRE.1
MASLRGKQVGLITIKTFSKDTARDVAAAVKALEGDGATALVIDLRHNPGVTAYRSRLYMAMQQQPQRVFVTSAIAYART